MRNCGMRDLFRQSLISAMLVHTRWTGALRCDKILGLRNAGSLKLLERGHRDRAFGQQTPDLGIANLLDAGEQNTQQFAHLGRTPVGAVAQVTEQIEDFSDLHVLAIHRERQVGDTLFEARDGGAEVEVRGERERTHDVLRVQRYVGRLDRQTQYHNGANDAMS